MCAAHQGNIETAADGQACDRDGASQRAGRSAPRLGPADSPARLKSRAQFVVIIHHEEGSKGAATCACSCCRARSFADQRPLHSPDLPMRRARPTAQNARACFARKHFEPRSLVGTTNGPPAGASLSSPTGEQGVDKGRSPRAQPDERAAQNARERHRADSRCVAREKSGSHERTLAHERGGGVEGGH